MPALRAAVATSPVPVTVDADGCADRLPSAVEAALYFVAMEAVQNSAKHANARMVSVSLGIEEGRCRLTVSDDGAGFDPAHADEAGSGAGLLNMRDRLDAVGGTVTLESAPGAGTTVTATAPVSLPVPAQQSRA